VRERARERLDAMEPLGECVPSPIPRGDACQLGSGPALGTMEPVHG